MSFAILRGSPPDDRTPMTRFAWDFFGPSARAVAEHFMSQLQARVREAPEPIVSWGSWLHAPDHAVVWLDAAPAAVAWVEHVLAPPRVLVDQRRV